MKGSGTVRRGGLVSKLRMSFVFSAGNQEKKRQSETEKREKQKASSKISAQAQLDIRVQAMAGQEQHTHARPEQVYVASEKEKKKPKKQTNNYYHIALQHNLTHRSQNIPWKGSTIILLYSGTKGEMP